MKETALSILSDLESRCFPYPYSQIQLRQMLDGADYRVLFLLSDGSIEKGEVSGAATGYLIANMNRAGDFSELHRIAVLPEARRRGFGDQLIQRYIDLCREAGLSRILLEVASRNSAARKLYHKAGFSINGERPHYYSDGDSAVVYERTL